MNEKSFESVRDLFANLTGYVPALLAGLAVLLLGLLVGWLVARIVPRLLILLRLDRVIGRLVWDRALQKADVRHSIFEFVGAASGVLIFIVFLDNAVTIWRLTAFARLLDELVLLVPRILIASVIMLIGMGVAAAVAKAVQRALHQEAFERATFVARVVRAAILVTTSAIAVVQMDIAVGIVTGAFLLAFGALALSFALAFGLGSRRAVERMWEERARNRAGASDPAADKLTVK